MESLKLCRSVVPQVVSLSRPCVMLWVGVAIQTRFAAKKTFLLIRELALRQRALVESCSVSPGAACEWSQDTDSSSSWT